MRTKKVMVLGAAALGVAGALAYGGVALADRAEPTTELVVVEDRNCPEKGQSAEPGAGQL